MKRDLRESTVVITGASSGIGRATALKLAREGANVVVTSRRGDALDELARECETRGGSALAVVADVTDEDQVARIAEEAVERFGRIDVWVNNAAVTAFGRFEETPPDIFRRVMETNFYGYVHGARAALRQFREQGSGTLINVSSVVGVVGQAYTSAYTSSKWAIRGFSESLRGELSLDEAKDIRVCTVLPAAIDTPLFQSSANYSGRAVRALDPTYDADVVARAIVKVARKPRREVYAGAVGPFAALLHGLLPGVVEPVSARIVERKHFQDRVQEPTEGNLFEPDSKFPASTSGGWETTFDKQSRAPTAGRGLAAIAGVSVFAFIFLRRRRSRTPSLRERAASLLPIGD
jgi:NAD(P)-dependent dehydrogenase (short-subunit alcohol dehydrogenase family)